MLRLPTRERVAAARVPVPRGGEVVVAPRLHLVPAVATEAAPPAPRTRPRLATSALVLTLISGAAVGLCLFEALAGVRLTRWDTVQAAFGWTAAAGVAAAGAFAGFLLAGVALVRRRGRAVAVAAMLCSVVAPVLAGWIGLTAGLHVLTVSVGASIADLSDSALGTAWRLLIAPQLDGR